MANKVECASCRGTGGRPEYHGPGLTEMLACDDCDGTGFIVLCEAYKEYDGHGCVLRLGHAGDHTAPTR